MLKRTELKNFQKIAMTVDVDKIHKIYMDNIDIFGNERDYINKSCGTPYMPENGYIQIPVTEFENQNYVFKNKSSGDTPEGDERNYRKLPDWVKGSYIEEVLDKFKSPYTRTRFCVINPGGFILPHIDYNTNYSVRYQIPITTNDWCYIGVQRKNEKPEIRHLETDGSVWFMNQGWNHSAWNMGKTDRIHMIVCVNGQEDL